MNHYLPHTPSDRWRDASMDTPPTELKLLRERQLSRNRKACLPCRRRKARCNHQQPCLACFKRVHADFCTYDEPPNLGTPRQQMNHQVVRPSTESDYNDSHHDIPSMPISHSNSASVQATAFLSRDYLIPAARSDSAGSLAENGRHTTITAGTLPLLGMDSTSQNSQSGPPRIPDTTVAYWGDMLKLFNVYRDRVHPFQPVIDDLVVVEKLLYSLFTRERELHQLDKHEICLMHAILAAVSQFSDLPAAERLTKSRKELQASLAILGPFDLLLNPFKRQLQALIVLGYVLQNGMNPRAAWILGGTTVRLALSIGLDKLQPTSGDVHLSESEAQHLRLAIVCQDALLSLAFGRPPASRALANKSDLTWPTPYSLPLDDNQAMDRLFHLILQYLEPVSYSDAHDRLATMLWDFEQLNKSLLPHLSRAENSISLQQCQEHFSLQLHMNFAVATLCWPSFQHLPPRHFAIAEEWVEMTDKFQYSLRQAVRSFIFLRSISDLATRSWAFVHSGLSSALLVTFVKESFEEAEATRKLQTEIVNILTESGENAGQFSHAHRKMLKAISVLQRLAEEEASKSQSSGSAREDNYKMFAQGVDYPYEFLIDSDAQTATSLDSWLQTFDHESSHHHQQG